MSQLINKHIKDRLVNIKEQLKDKKHTTCSLKARIDEIKMFMNALPNVKSVLYVDVGYIDEFLKNRKFYLEIK